MVHYSKAELAVLHEHAHQVLLVQKTKMPVSKLTDFETLTDCACIAYIYGQIMDYQIALSERENRICGTRVSLMIRVPQEQNSESDCLFILDKHLSRVTAIARTGLAMVHRT